MNAGLLRRVTSRVIATVEEMNYAQRRLTELRLTQDRYLIEPDEAPATYQDFLARTAGLRLLREPSARDREQGQRGRRR
jgi:hypothetical protein